MTEYIAITTNHKEFFDRWRHLYDLKDDANEALLLIAMQALARGVVVFVVTGGKTVAACVATGDKMGVIRLHTLPKSCGEDYGKKCLAVVKEWADKKGYHEIRVATENWSGASFRYFEKTLGMRRRFAEFSLIL
jgi:GNAT superfamily N-acetyltransferase